MIYDCFANSRPHHPMFVSIFDCKMKFFDMRSSVKPMTRGQPFEAKSRDFCASAQKPLLFYE